MVFVVMVDFYDENYDHGDGDGDGDDDDDDNNYDDHDCSDGIDMVVII